MSEPKEKCAVRPGDRVIDLGCQLADRAREITGEPAPVVTVVAVFPWGLRIRNDAGELYDCTRWALPQ